MIAIEVRGNAISWDSEFAGETDTLMASGAGITGEILGRHGRVRVFVRFDGVNAMAVSTDG